MAEQLSVPPRQRVRQGHVTPSARFLIIRFTGLLLAVLALGHFALTHVINDVAATGSSFIARRWSSALWLTWDGLLLGCALLHAGVASIAVVRDYSTSQTSRHRWLVALGIGSTALFLIGLVVLLGAGVGNTR